MTELNNITVTPLEDGMVSLFIDGEPITDKCGMKFEAINVNDIQEIDSGQKIKLFDQFVFSHTDLNFEHAYHYVTGIEKLEYAYKEVKNVVYRIKIEGQPEIEHVISKQGAPMSTEDVREFINAHIQKSLTDYTDLNYAY